MTDVERAIVRAILVAAKVPDSERDWMVASCPSMQRARELYPRGVRHEVGHVTLSQDACARVRAAAQAVTDARQSGSETAAELALHDLERVVVEVQAEHEVRAASLQGGSVPGGQQ